PGTLAAQVVLRGLIDMGRHDLQWGAVPFALARVAGQEAFAHVPGVRALAPLRRENGQFLPRSRRLLRRHQPRTGSQERSSRDHGFSPTTGPLFAWIRRWVPASRTRTDSPSNEADTTATRTKVPCRPARVRATSRSSGRMISRTPRTSPTCQSRLVLSGWVL